MRKVGPPTGRRERQLVAALSIVAAFFLPLLVRAQGARPEDDIVLRNQNGLAAVLPGASIYTCAANATVNFNVVPPCTGVSVFSDPALTMMITQPLLSDANGNFTEYGPGCIQYTLAFTYPNTPGFAKQWTAPCVNGSSPTFATLTATAGIFTTLTATNETVTNLTITGSCTGACGAGTPGGASGTAQFNNSGVFGGILGSSVTPSTGATSLTAGADTTKPLAINSHSNTQSATEFDVSNQSSGGAGTGTLAAPLLVEGRGYGAFTPGSVTAVMAIQQESSATANIGLVITNKQAVSSSSRTSTIGLQVPDNGIGSINGGNAVGDGSGDYDFIYFDDDPVRYGAVSHPGNIGVSMIENPNATSQVPVVIGNLNPAATGHILDIVNSTSTAPLAGWDASANLLTHGGTTGQLLQNSGGAAPQSTSWVTPTALSCTYQSPLAPVTGTGAAATYYTCSVPALAAGTGINIIVVSKHTTGTANVAYTVQFGGTSTTASTPTGSANQLEVIRCILMNNVGSTTAQTVTTQYMDSNAANLVTQLNTMAINTGSAQTLNIQFSVANTDAITPEQFLVQLVQ